MSMKRGVSFRPSTSRWQRPRTFLHMEPSMGDQRARAMGGSCLGAMLGLFLGGVVGGLGGWFWIGSTTANGPQGVAILDIVNTLLLWLFILLGTIVGGLGGVVVGA